VNLSAFLIGIAYRAAKQARKYRSRDVSRDVLTQEAVLIAVVFAWLAVEALLNEQAYVEIHDFGHGSKVVYDAVERGARGFDRVQAILTYLYGQGLKDGEHPANDLKLLEKLRNGVVHYKFRDHRVVSALDDLAQRGHLSAPTQPWDKVPVTWATYVRPELAEWAYHTACDTAEAITALMPDDTPHKAEVGIIRVNFRKDRLDEGE